MEDENNNQQDPAAGEGQQQEVTPQTEEPHGEPDGSGTDWKAEARKWEQRSKENKVAAEEAKAELESYKAAAARQDLVERIAGKHGVSAALLGRMEGATAEAIEANAAFIRENVSVYPALQDGGTTPPKTVTKEGILGIQNERERLKAIAENSELFI